MKPKLIRASTVPVSLATFCKGFLKELSDEYEVIALSSPGEDLKLIAECENVRTIVLLLKQGYCVWLQHG